MDIWFAEAWNILDRFNTSSVIRLCEDMIDQTLLGKRVHDPWNEVSREAVRRWVVDFEGWVRERSIKDTSSPKATSEIEDIDRSIGFNKGAVATEASVRIEDWTIVDIGA
jgi:hypothetical protein